MLGTPSAYSQETKSIPPSPVALVVKLGMSEDGAVTSEWIEAIRQRHDEEALSAIQAIKKRLSEEEALWAGLIKRKVSTWLAMIDSLQIPFQAITPPDTVAILLGNLGGEDAFVYSDTTICFDLSKLHSYYGSASTTANSGRIDRFFAHEFTHLLHKAWRKKHGLKLESPFEYALWECLTEGLGNYRSLSDKWILAGGKLTQHAHEVLSRLQPIFIKRLSALEHATAAEAAPLLEGLSMGPFDQKWGALTVALWLVQEARKASGEVLELMCGTGRVSLPLVEAGVSLTCVDSSPQMLNVLRQKLDARHLSANVQEMDVCALALPQRFDLLFIPFHSFSEILSPDDQHTTLEHVRDHLSDNGRFICTLHNPVVRRQSVDSQLRLVNSACFPTSTPCWCGSNRLMPVMKRW
jgi:SAM-dependent methyltransferase